MLNAQEQAAPNDQDQEDGNDDAAPEGNQRPQNRKEMEQIKAKFENKVQLAHHYHQDPFLPLELKVIFWASHSLLKDYEQTLKTRKSGQDKGFKMQKKNWSIQSLSSLHVFPNYALQLYGIRRNTRGDRGS